MKLRKVTFYLFVVLTEIFLLSACLPAPVVELEIQTPVAAAVENSPTPPVTWFPATSTPTAFPHAISTQGPIAQSGIENLISDSELSSAANWTNVAVNNDDPNKLIWNDGALYFAVNQSPADLFTINNNLLLENFYIEVQFELNRCSPNDTYGILFLADNERLGNRFVLRCDGSARILQARENMNIPLTDWVFTGAAPPAAPGMVKAAIWVFNGELRFFLNEQIQFTVSDRFYKSGGFGFFVESKDPAGMNVKVHDLNIYNVLSADTTPTATP